MLQLLFCTMAYLSRLSEPICSFEAPARQLSSMLHMRGTHRVGVCLHAHCLPLTTPPSASAAAPPPPPPTIVGTDAFRTQCGGRAVCCEGRLAERAGGGPTGVSNTMQLQARASEFLKHHAAPALVTGTPPQTHQAPQITLAGRGKGRSAAPGGRGHCA